MASKDSGKAGKDKVSKKGVLGMTLGEGGKYPSKTSINLYIVEKHTGKNIIALIIFAIFMCGLYFFSKYFVSGAIEEADRLEATYSQRLETLAKMQEQVESEGGDAQIEYAHYSNDYMTDDEKALQDRMAILDVIERRLLKIGALEEIDLQGNVATLTINSDRLSNVSQITAELEDENIVSYVTVSTAQKNLIPVAGQEETLTAGDETEAETAQPETAEAVPARTSSEDETEDEAEGETETESETDPAPETEEILKPEVVTTMTIYFMTPDEVESMSTEGETEPENPQARPTGTAVVSMEAEP